MLTKQARIYISGLIVFSLLVGILAGISLFSNVKAEGETPMNTGTYTPTTEKHCDAAKGTCTVSIYANTKYVYEDNTWKPIEQARSLLSVWTPEYLEIDPKYNLTLIDVNYTSVSLCLNINPSEVGKQIPFKRCSISTGVCTSFLVLFNQPIDKCYNLTLNPLDYNYTFGFNSTTIRINNGGAVLEDLWLTDTIGGDDAEASMLKFNITAIPAGQTIMNATFCGYVNATLATDSTLATDVKVDTTLSEWVEATAAATLTGFTYNNITTQVFTSITKNTWTCTDVTLQLKQAYLNSKQNATFRFQPTARTFTNIDVRTDNSGLRIGDTDDYISLNDRENTLASGNYPYINVTYRSDFTAPTFTSNGTNMTTLSNVNGTWVKLFVNWTDNVKLNYTWIGSNFSGVWINETPVARAGLTTINHTNSTMITSGNNKNICWQSWANDTDNNINTTGLYCYDIYKYGMLQVNITSPANKTNVTQNTTFYLNATVTCVGTDAVCGVVSAYARYNGSSGSPNMLINSTFSNLTLISTLMQQSCFQGSANITNQEITPDDSCSLVYTGSYTTTGTWDHAIYANDGTNSNEANTTQNGAAFYINYTMPSGVIITSSIWYWNYPNTDEYMPLFLCDAATNTLQLKLNYSTTTSKEEFYCWKNNDWTFIADRENLVHRAFISEDAMNWSVLLSTFQINPILSGSLSSNDNFNVSWLINATGTDNTQYLVDVLFNSSLGNSLVPDNSTDDMKVCIGACPIEGPVGATQFSVSIFTGSTYCCNLSSNDTFPGNQTFNFTAVNGDIYFNVSANTAVNISPYANGGTAPQDSTYGIFRYCNSGVATISSLVANISTEGYSSCITLHGGTSYALTPNTLTNSSFVTIASSLAAGSCQDYWLMANFNKCVAGNYNATIQNQA